MTRTELRALRQSLGLTQGQAARLFGVYDRTWRRWEGGEADISKPVALLVQMAVELPGALDWVRGREGAPQ